MKFCTQMSCKFIRLLETFLSSSKIIPAYLQYDKELFASWPCHTPRSQSISDWLPLGFSRLADTWLSPNPSVTFPLFEHKIIELCQCIPRGVRYNPRLILSKRKSLTECIHKGGGHTKYDLQNIIYN